MSTPSRPLADPANGGSCCGGKAPYPAWRNFEFAWILSLDSNKPSFANDADLEAYFRNQAIQAWVNPDRPWCGRCSTALEDFRDEIGNAFPLMLQAVATIASIIPGFGTVAADILGTMAALAAGESLSDALVSGLLDALPGGAAWAAAGNAAKGLLAGERLDHALADGARAAIEEEAGPLAAAAFDGLIALASGKQLQDAGFAALHALAAGNTLEEKAVTYGEQVARAVESGRSVLDVLVADLAADVLAQAGPAAFRAAAMCIARIKLDPSLLDVSPATLAALVGTTEAVARGAQAVMRTGTEDHELSGTLFPVIIISAAPSSATQAGAAKVTAASSLSPALRLRLISVVPRRSVAAAIAKATIQPVKPTAAVAKPAGPPAAAVASPSTSVHAPSPSSPAASSSSPAAAVVLGGAVGVAGLLVAWLVWRK